MVEMARLRESTTNPRRHFGEAGLEELAASIGKHGVLNALLVRPAGQGSRGQGVGSRKGRKAKGNAEGDWTQEEIDAALDEVNSEFGEGKSTKAKDRKAKAGQELAPAEQGGALEVVCGARRFRAAKAAGLTEIPVRIEELTDEQVLEIQVIENLQREEVHPLDEAMGYRTLMATGHYTVLELAEKVGKSERYLYGRMKLTDLIEAGQKQYWQGKIGLGVALLIARLTAEQQKETLGELRHYGDYPSPARVEDFIESSYLLTLGKAPFDIRESTLGGMPSCTECAKRTGANPMLFPEVTAKDTCTDPTCYRAKVAALIERRKSEARDGGEELVEVCDAYVYGENKPKKALEHHAYAVVEKGSPCPHPRPAIVVAGNEVGKSLVICTDAKCKQHRHSASRGGSGYKPTPAEVKRREEERQGREVLKAVQLELKERLVENDYGAGSQVLTGPDLDLVATHVVEDLGWNGAKGACDRLGVKIKDRQGYQRGDTAKATLMRHICGIKADSEKVHVVVQLAAQGLVEEYVPIVAASYGVKVEAIRAQVRAKAEAAAAKRARGNPTPRSLKAAATKGKGAKPTKVPKPAKAGRDGGPSGLATAKKGKKRGRR